MQPIAGLIDRHHLTLDAPIDRWDEAIPLGNGLLGVLLWGQANQLRLSLDRGDLWDLRIPDALCSPKATWKTIIDAVRRGDHAEIDEVFNRPAKEIPYPTKLPTGRLELDLDDHVAVESFHLDLRRALGTARFAGGRGALEVFCASDRPVVLARLRGTQLNARFVAPGFGEDRKGPGGLTQRSAAQLNYPAPQPGHDGTFQWSRQGCADGHEYILAMDVREAGETLELAITVTTDADGADPLNEARRRLTETLDEGFDAVFESHLPYWDRYWSQSAVDLGGGEIERHYYLTQYFGGSASRLGYPPMALQGLWTADDGLLPPWKGDYHHDLNTELTYWAYLPANHLDEGRCFFEFLWNLMPRFREFARAFYDAPGACVPSVMSQDGRPMGGWPQYSRSPVNGAWLAHGFHRHWRYTLDQAFLETRAYPFCHEIAQCLDALLEPDAEGWLKLPLSTSPESHANRPEAWLTPNSNYDLSLIRWLFEAVAEMAAELDEEATRDHFRNRLAKLEDLAVGPQAYKGGLSWSVEQTLYLAPGEPLNESHRHFSHTLAIHPLGILNVEGSQRDRQVIHDSIRVLDCLGHEFWCGYSFSWMACIAARVGMPERALAMLETYLRATVSRNGFHLNGDFRSLGVTALNYRPFTLEGNFAAAEAVHEMLLQSWGGTVRVFPAVPDAWRDCGYDDLRAEGALRVSARRIGGRTSWVRIVAEQDRFIQLRDPFPGRSAAIEGANLRLERGAYVGQVQAGDQIILKAPEA